MIELKEEGPFGEVGEQKEVMTCLLGVGSAGVNIIDQLVLARIAPEHVVCIDSDQQVIMGSVAKETYLVGSTEVFGGGTGGDPELGAALMDKDLHGVMELLKDYETIYVVIGLGGGTGSGMMPVLAKALKQKGITVIVFATTPYGFEGKRRRDQAWLASRTIYEVVDALFLLSNDRPLAKGVQSIDIRAENQAINTMMGVMLKSLIDVSTAKGLMEVKASDMRTITRKSREDIISTENCWIAHGVGEGEERVRVAIEDLLASPYLADSSAWDEGEYILVTLIGGRNMSMAEFQGVMNVLRGEIPVDLPILSSAAVAESVEDYLQITLIVTGYVEDEIANAYMMPHAQEDLNFIGGEEVPNPGSNLIGLGSASKGQIKNSSLHSEVSLEEQLDVKQHYVEGELVSEDELLLDLKNVFDDQTAQDELPLDTKVNVGRFAKSAPTIVKGQNLDQPTFMRLNMQIKL